jgi:hypothetical protein
MIGWNYGYWCHCDGSSYWGIRLANTVPIGESLHHLPMDVKARLLAWKFA